MALDPFAGAKKVEQNQVAFNKLGDYIIGYVSGSKDITTDRGTTKLYELKAVQGEFHKAETTTDENGNKQVKVDKDATKVVAGEYYTIWGGKDSIDDLFKKAKINQKVGLRFKEAIASKKKGNSPFKVFEPVMWDEFDKDNGFDNAPTSDLSNAEDSSQVEGVNF